MSQIFRSFEANSGTIQRKRGMFKKVVQQGRRALGARSVHGVREHAQSSRTQLAAFFNIPRKGSEDLTKSSTSAVDLSNLGQGPRGGNGWADYGRPEFGGHGVQALWPLPGDWPLGGGRRIGEESSRRLGVQGH